MRFSVTFFFGCLFSLIMLGCGTDESLVPFNSDRLASINSSEEEERAFLQLRDFSENYALTFLDRSGTQVETPKSSLQMSNIYKIKLTWESEPMTLEHVVIDKSNLIILMGE